MCDLFSVNMFFGIVSGAPRAAGALVAPGGIAQDSLKSEFQRGPRRERRLRARMPLAQRIAPPPTPLTHSPAHTPLLSPDLCHQRRIVSGRGRGWAREGGFSADIGKNRLADAPGERGQVVEMAVRAAVWPLFSW